jgi:iron complex transport system ATP-binding protein
VSDPIDESIRAGELTCLIGPNGAGKSTLMRTMAGLQAPLAGAVRLDGHDVHRMPPVKRARQLAVVLTEPIQVPMLSAYNLVAFGRAPFTDWKGTLSADDHQLVVDSLREVGAEDLAHRDIGELSDGERQRVMIARALVQQPSAMILDEITGFLDLPHRIEIMRLLRRTAHDHHCAVLLSTHDLDLALRMTDRIWLMSKGRALRADLPETLVLDGSFQTAFKLDEVSFDQHSGAFRVQHQGQWPIRLVGAPPAVTWTERALERHGFYVVPDDERSVAGVRVAGSAEQFRWHLEIDGALSEHRSLGAAIDALRAARPDAARAASEDHR